MKPGYVYLLASRRNGTLYVGVTSDLVKRVWQHKNDLVEGFTKRYGVHTLVWYEVHESMESAIRRERAIKEWKRAWKLALIEKENPTWRDPVRGNRLSSTSAQILAETGDSVETSPSPSPLDSGFRRSDRVWNLTGYWR